MKRPSPMVDYRKLSIKSLKQDEFRHLKLLLYWPLFGVFFLYVERFHPVKTYYPMYCPLDDLIPFCEIFAIPYLFWFVFLIGIHVYTLLYDIDGFKKLMKFIMITYSAAMLIFFLFPTCQRLRPAAFERDNIFTRFLVGFYQFDTNTNVCPSIHVIGSLAVLFTAWNCEQFQSKGWRLGFCVAAFLISVSTVFLKQHSILDVLAAIPICLIAYPLCFSKIDLGDIRLRRRRLHGEQ